MDRNIPHEERMQRVEDVMNELSLKKCEKTLIGVQGRIKGISGKTRSNRFLKVSYIQNEFMMS